MILSNFDIKKYLDWLNSLPLWKRTYIVIKNCLNSLKKETRRVVSC